MRLIDADRLREFFETESGDQSYKFIDLSTAFKFALRTIDKAPTIDPDVLRPQWISVAERLPPEEQYVLITQKERYPGQAEEGEFHPVVESCFSDNCWFMSDSEIYFYDEDVVYAWMPLPEPYEPDGVKDEGE